MYKVCRIPHSGIGGDSMRAGQTDGRTEGQTDEGIHNIPIAFEMRFIVPFNNISVISGHCRYIVLDTSTPYHTCSPI